MGVLTKGYTPQQNTVCLTREEARRYVRHRRVQLARQDHPVAI
jgi:hypothetical protein